MIQVFTNTTAKDNGFIFEQHLFYNFVKVGVASVFNVCDDKLQADIFNLGFAVRDIIANDKRFGGCTVPSKQMHNYDNETRQDYWTTAYDKYIYYRLPLEQKPPIKIRRIAVCYTDNLRIKDLLLNPVLAQRNRIAIERITGLIDANKITVVGASVEMMQDKNALRQLKKIYE